MKLKKKKIYQSEYSKNVRYSLTTALSISAIFTSTLVLIPETVLWLDILITLGVNLVAYLGLWKVIDIIVLKFISNSWEKSNIVINGEWSVIHYSESANYKTYLRKGKVKINQHMDECILNGENTSPNNENVTKWHSITNYKYDIKEESLYGPYEAIRLNAKNKNDTTGFHDLKIVNDTNFDTSTPTTYLDRCIKCEVAEMCKIYKINFKKNKTKKSNFVQVYKIKGSFHNAKKVEGKPREGIIEMYQCVKSYREKLEELEALIDNSTK